VGKKISGTEVTQWILRAAAAAVLILLMFRIFSSVSSSGNLIRAIEKRSYTTDSEHSALVLISCCMMLVTCLFLSLTALLSSYAKENKKIVFFLSFGILFGFYLFGCLDGYALLNNHFITALLITGKYTMRLLLSIVNLVAGIFGAATDWESGIFWYVVSACLFLFPFILAGEALGKKNFWKTFLVSVLFGAAYFLSHFYPVKGVIQIIISAGIAFAAAGELAFLTDRKVFGSGSKKKKESLLNLKVDKKKRMAFLIAGIVLWGITLFTGQIKSFSGMMKVVFGSDLFRFQNNAGSVSSLSVARTLLISYLLSLLVRALFQRISIQDEFRFSGFLTASYMLLLQIWVMPFISSFLIRTAENIKINISDADMDQAAASLKNAAGNYLDLQHTNYAWALIIGCIVLGIVLVFLFAVLAVNVTVFRYVLSFLLYFSICMYVYSLIILFWGRSPSTIFTLLLCYFMNRLISRLLSIGPAIKSKFQTE